MVRRIASVISASTLIVFTVAAVASAQDEREQPEAPAHISLVEGVAVLERDGRTDDAPAQMPLLAGDRIRTRAGRVEILFADGSTLHLDHNSAIDLQSDELVRLLDGRLRLSIPVRARDVGYRIDGPHAWAQISQPGDYRAAVIQNAGHTELEFAVLRGAAELTNEGGRTTLRAGERAFARANAAPSHAYVFNSMSFDPFDRWSEARRSEQLALSSQYLPDEVRPYAATLDRHGSWEYEPSYGQVWYPRVSYGWRPYHYGRWSSLSPFGWTWIAADPWGWPTHHYGRWGFSARGSWFWIPGRRWAPAWVSWAFAPGFVSWCPLGFNNRPVFQIINVHHGYNPWRGWTVLSHRDFGVGFVHRRSLVGSAIDGRTLSAFAHRDSGPAITGHAVPRGTIASPIRLAGTAGSRRAPLQSTAPVNPGSDRFRTTTGGVVDLTRRPSSDGSRTGAAIGRERTTPDRPLIRSQQRERGLRATPPSPNYNEPSRARPIAPGSRRDGGLDASPYAPERRAMPRGEYGRPGGSQPDARVDRPSSGGSFERRPPTSARPSYGPPGAIERRAPGGDRQPAPSARPDRSGRPPAANQPSGGRPRGDAPSRGAAVRRPGGGR
jgi:hypothetical protein